MANTNLGCMISQDKISDVIATFIEVKKTENKSPNTILFYTRECNYFNNWISQIPITTIDQITPDYIRGYLDYLKIKRNAGGIHAAYRSIKSLCYFYDFEYEPDNWKNPIKKVKIPNPKIQPLPGIPKKDVDTLIDISKNCRCGIRDRAILNCLSSSGCRASELLTLNIDDINLITGTTKVRHGKGDKYRITFIDRESRRALRKYLSTREYDNFDPLFLNEEGTRLTISGLRHLVLKHCDSAGIKKYGLHDFRRYFALNLYRNHVSVFEISLLLGHSSVEITKKYLDIGEQDLKQAYLLGNPFD
ncbi:MAG: tyrosine-type recombinase/integrase [Chloroflexi bacterium]|nr:tyrosine-type recombinase/integrase [Chloroflexota bacterium]